MRTIRRSMLKMTLLFGTFIYMCLLLNTQVFAATEPTLTITLGSIDVLNLKSGSFGAVSQNVEVTTNNYTGCSVSLLNPVNSTDLINTIDNTLIIPTITLPANTESIAAEDFSNGYGISTDGEHYVPAPTTEGHILVGNSATSGDGSYLLTYGVKLSEETSPGSYVKTFIVAAVVNNPQYSISYNANAGSDAVTGMPSNQGVTIASGSAITLPNNSPTRSGYTFLGWDENSTTITNPTYAPGSTIDLEPTQANAITLYAIWESTPEPIVADYTEDFVDTGGSTASATTSLPNLTPTDYITKIFAYTNNTGRTISSISVEIVYSKSNQGGTSGSLIGKLNVNGTEYSASPVSVGRNRVTNAHLSIAQFNNLNIPSSNNISFTIGAESNSFTANITISSQTVTVTFAD